MEVFGELLWYLFGLETPGHDLLKQISGLSKIRLGHTIDDCKLIDLLVVLNESDSPLYQFRIEIVEV